MATGNWHMINPAPGFIALWRRHNGDDVPAPAHYRNPNGLTALVGREPVADDDWRWHISVRYGDPGINGRIPTWEEMVNAAHELRPGVCFVIAVPPRSWWMNVHPDVLHLHEVHDPALVEEWRRNAMDSVPS
jgi:hypothetical protein